jgi:hypothetical protein
VAALARAAERGLGQGEARARLERAAPKTPLAVGALTD